VEDWIRERDRRKVVLVKPKDRGGDGFNESAFFLVVAGMWSRFAKGGTSRLRQALDLNDKGYAK
jgi:hypothetical protein